MMINHSLAKILNNFVRDNHLEGLIGFFSDFPIFFLPVFLISTWLYWTFKSNNIEEKKKIIFIFLSVFFAIIINMIIQQFYFEDRPMSFVDSIIKHIPDNSFPSDHSTVSFAFLFALFFAGYKNFFWFFTPFVLLMNFARIAGGIHWFFDIIAGLIIGFATAYIIFKYLIKNRTIDKINDFVIKSMGFFKL